MPNRLDTHSSTAPHEVREFLGISFDLAPKSYWQELYLRASRDPLRYLVTPNVDHIVRLSKDSAVAELYRAAAWRVCDSRILDRLARGRGFDLAPYPGSDLTADLLNDPRARALTIGVIGPDRAHYDRLTALYPSLTLRFINTPFMSRGSVEWNHTLEAAETADCDLLLICISFPKQEFFAYDLAKRGRARGIALCVGASLDFLTGTQKRAPLWMQKSSLEWAHRLASNPARLWKRYLIDGPRIFYLYVKSR
ncbi:WecB/TagA/CpsF family glycosyltransferase [Thioclava kandeliae]|uniref:WecB/TagA/CpsF family glycosyltransferase n=1 Tax=Thioclava kandeliae TaxID=3070818 RepID=A0ABV1SLS6_9RHOB